MSDLLDLMRIDMVVQNTEHRAHRIIGADRFHGTQFCRNDREKFVCRSPCLRRFTWSPLVIIDAAHQQRQLRAKMCGEIGRNPVADGSQYCTQYSHASFRSRGSVAIISSNQVLVIWSVLSNTSRPVALMKLLHRSIGDKE